MKKIFTLFALLIFTINTANAAIRISPSYIELNANKTKKDYITGSFTVSGGKDEVIRFKIYPVFFERDAKGGFVELPDNGQKNSLMGKVKVYPTEFTCQNGLDQKIRFTVTGLKTLPSGESRLMLFLEDVNVKEIVLKNASGGAGGKILLKTRVGVPVYVDKGLFAKKGNLDTVALKQVGESYACEYKVSSNGNSQIRYNGLGYISQGDNLIKKFDMVGAVIEGGKSIERIQKIDLPKDALVTGQEYKVKCVLTYRDEHDKEKIMKKEFTYTPLPNLTNGKI